MRLLSILVVSTLVACASSWDEGWVKPGADAQALASDRRACLQDATVGKSVGAFGYDAPDQVLFESCMKRNGWRKGTSEQ
jgi:hypothetical protein